MERIKRIQILDQKLQIPFNSLKDLTSIKQEIKDIAATEEIQPFNITEFELLSGVTFLLTTKIFNFLTDINSGQKQVGDVDLAELEKILKELPEKRLLLQKLWHKFWRQTEKMQRHSLKEV